MHSFFEAVIHPEAERIVTERWDQIMALTQALADAGGRLQGDDPVLLTGLRW